MDIFEKLVTHARCGPLQIPPSWNPRWLRFRKWSICISNWSSWQAEHMSWAFIWFSSV